MVDVTGHFGMALLFAAPAWLVWGQRGALGFTGFALVTAMLPDIDLVLQHVLPITHHGITHTLLFVSVMSVIVGAGAAKWLTDWFNATRLVRSSSISDETVFVFATAGLAVGGLSHLFADLLSAPDIAPPIEPFWPLYAKPVIVDAIYYNSPVWNVGLFAAALTLHALLVWHERVPFENRYRLGS